MCGERGECVGINFTDNKPKFTSISSPSKTNMKYPDIEESTSLKSSYGFKPPTAHPVLKVVFQTVDYPRKH